MIAVEIETVNSLSTSGCKVICCNSDDAWADTLLSSCEAAATKATSDDVGLIRQGFFDEDSSG